jgi:hypothetical protein
MAATRHYEKIISADSHFMEPYDLWWNALGPKFGDRTPRLLDQYQGRQGTFFYSVLRFTISVLVTRAGESTNKRKHSKSTWSSFLKRSTKTAYHVHVYVAALPSRSKAHSAMSRLRAYHTPSYRGAFFPQCSGGVSHPFERVKSHLKSLPSTALPEAVSSGHS